MTPQEQAAFVVQFLFLDDKLSYHLTPEAWRTNALELTRWALDQGLLDDSTGTRSVNWEALGNLSDAIDEALIGEDDLMDEDVHHARTVIRMELWGFIEGMSMTISFSTVTSQVTPTHVHHDGPHISIREYTAWQLRQAGLTYKAIGKEMRVSYSQASRIVHKVERFRSWCRYKEIKLLKSYEIDINPVPDWDWEEEQREDNRDFRFVRA